MFYLAIVLQWLHVLFAIAWFGSAIFLDFVLYPSVIRLDSGTRVRFNDAYIPRFKRFIPVAGGMTVLTGILRGLVLGLNFSTPYGPTYVGAVVLGIVVIIFGARVLGPTYERVAIQEGALQDGAWARFRRLTYFDLGAFLILFSLMIAMRFGY